MEIHVVVVWRPLSLISNSRRVMKFACLSTFVRVRGKRDTVLQVITLVGGIHDSTIPRTFFFHTLRGNLVTLHNNHSSPPPLPYTNPQVSTVSTWRMWIDPKLAEHWQISDSIKEIDEFEVTERGVSLKYSFRSLYTACVRTHSISPLCIYNRVNICIETFFFPNLLQCLRDKFYFPRIGAIRSPKNYNYFQELINRRNNVSTFFSSIHIDSKNQ